MNILVTGGAGFIGSQTVAALIAAGHSVAVFDSFENGHAESLDGLVEKDRIFKGSIVNESDVDRVMSSQPFDGVVHFAAYLDVGESVGNPGKFFKNNTVGTINVINAMLAHGIHQLVFSSTAAVYGQPPTMPIAEDSPKQPTNPYGTSKWLVEQAIDDFVTFTPLKATILRYFNAAGADSGGKRGEFHHPETHLIPLILQVAQRQRDHIKIFGTDYPTKDGTTIRDYIHVEDLADAHVMALEKQANSDEKLWTFNVGTGHGYSVKEVIKSCREVTGHPIPAINAPRRDGDPAELVADARLIQTKLGWQPKRSNLKTIVADAWNWQKHRP